MAFRCVVSMPNAKGAGFINEQFFPNDETGAAQIAEFIRREDRPGRAVYECIGLVSERRRAKDTVVSLQQIIVDEDLKNIKQSREEVIECARALALPPTEIVDSGHGLHIKWRLKEPLIDSAGFEEAERTMKALARLLAGDPLPTHRAALLRCIGSHNTKEEPARECRVIVNGGAECDISEFADMLDLYGNRALLEYKEKEGEPRLALSAPPGPIDIAARLAAMQYGGAADTSIHFTQLAVAASLTRAGRPIAETVERVLARTQEVAPENEKWDWEKERRDIEDMCKDLVNKAPELAHTLPDELFRAWNAVLDKGERPNLSRNRYGLFVRATPPRDNIAAAAEISGNVVQFVRPDEESQERKKPRAALSVKEWIERALPEPAFCLGWWLTTTTRALVYAPTGIGKSLLAVAIAFASSNGNSFLHWTGHRKMRVLYIDGEMAQRLLKRRIMEEAERSHSEPEGLYAVNTGDIEDFKPLDDPRGRAAIDEEIKAMEGVDLIIFDNIMALLGGDMKDEESWRKTLDWQKSLTRRHIGQIWIHHTGHDESKGYGTKTREWQMDTVIALEKSERPETDVSFVLTFKKARERTPETRSDFKDVRVTLINNRWEFELIAEDGRQKPSPMGEQFKRALINVLASDEAVTYRGHRAARLDAWRKECVTLGLLDAENRAHSARTLLSKYRRELIQCRLIGCHEELTWLL